MQAWSLSPHLLQQTWPLFLTYLVTELVSCKASHALILGTFMRLFPMEGNSNWRPEQSRAAMQCRYTWFTCRVTRSRDQFGFPEGTGNHARRPWSQSLAAVQLERMPLDIWLYSNGINA